MRILELFAGIGGVAAAIATDRELSAEIVQAIDIDTVARSVYQHNFRWDYRVAELASIQPQEFVALGANLWWMSPPCLPFSVRGLRKDLHDSRNHAFKHLIEVITTVRPPVVVLENVPGFEVSESCKLFTSELSIADYRHQIIDVCPTEFGWRNRRRRIYLVAWQQSICNSDRIVNNISLRDTQVSSLSSMIDDRISRASFPELYLDEVVQKKYIMALNRLTIADIQNGKPSACFAASYGKTYLHAGSYLVANDGVRRFSPDEVKRQLGFSDRFTFAKDISTRNAWKLLGSSLSIPVVQWLLKAIHRGVDLD